MLNGGNPAEHYTYKRLHHLSVTSAQFGSLQQDFSESFEWQVTQQATLKSFNGCF